MKTSSVGFADHGHDENIMLLQLFTVMALSLMKILQLEQLLGRTLETRLGQ